MFMSNLPAPNPDPAVDQAAADAAYYKRVLHELIDMGMGLARMLHVEATRMLDVPPPEPGQPFIPPNINFRPTPAFDRLARNIRRTIMLARSLDEPVTPRVPKRPARTAARQTIIRRVEDEIQREADGPEAESLHAELRERLDAPEFEDDLATRPIDDIIAEIRHDLGLAATSSLRFWKRRTPAELAILHARAAAPPGAASDPSLTIAWPPRPSTIPHRPLAQMRTSLPIHGKPRT